MRIIPVTPLEFCGLLHLCCTHKETDALKSKQLPVTHSYMEGELELTDVQLQNPHQHHAVALLFT